MNKKNTLIFNLVCFVIPLLIIGLWMIFGQKPEDRAVEKVSYSAMKAIWGQPSGLTILVFDLFLLTSFILKYRRKPTIKRPEISFLIYDFSFPIFLYTVVIFSIINLQTFLAQSSIIPSIFEHIETSSIDLISITVIVVFGLSTLITKIINRKK